MLALQTSMLSPVAGLFLAVAAAALVVCGRRLQGPYMGLAAAVLGGVPRQWRVIRASAAIYAVGTLAAWLLPTAVGANADRLGELLAGPVLIGLAGPAGSCPPGRPQPGGLYLSWHWPGPRRGWPPVYRPG